MNTIANYSTFLDSKRQLAGDYGFAPKWMPDFLYPFQQALTEWNIRKGRSATFADCGLGKTPMQLVWAENVVRHTNKPVLILTPLAVARQTEREATKFGIDAINADSIPTGKKIIIANYERLHYFDPSNFAGVVCDESSILKSFSGATRKQITRFMAKMEFRLLCTATAAPNDYVELGTSSEALGELNYSEMLRMFFCYLDDKGQSKEQRQQDQAEKIIANDPNYFKKLAYRVAQTIGQWRLKHHAVDSFWRWVASWSRACRKPSDLGFDDTGFVLPTLNVVDHIIETDSSPEGMLFAVPAFGMGEEREERRRTIRERCEFVAGLVNHKEPAVVWCHMNDEGDMLEDMIPCAGQIAGRTPDEKKIELYEAFASGQLRVLVIKPKIGAFGLNWQHCAHTVTFPSHSYEQYYQAIRRCWRFGQKRPVTVDVVATEGESRVMGNMRRKADKADKMFASLISHMHNAERVRAVDNYKTALQAPAWLAKEK